MKLPRLSPDEIRALRFHGPDAEWNLAQRIKAHLMAALPVQVRVGASVLALPVTALAGEPPRVHADDDLLAAWVAARFGSDGVSGPVPARYGASLLARVAQALAEFVLSGQRDEASSLHLQIQLNDQHGKLELDWSGMSADALKIWAVKQWGSSHE